MRARSEGALRQGAGRRDQELHRHLVALRGAGASRDPSETAGRAPEDMVAEIEDWLNRADDTAQFDEGGGI